MKRELDIILFVSDRWHRGFRDMHVSTGPLLWLFVLMQTSLAIGPTAHAAIGKKKVLTVGYLTAIKGELKDRQGLAVSGAVTMALNEVIS